MNELDLFSREQAQRFQRHFALAGFGIAAQARLLRSRVLVIGAGGLGSPVLTYLAAAGVGSIDIVDDDVVERSNLHRQVIHSEATLNQPKTRSAAAAMRGLHPEISITEHQLRVSEHSIAELITPVDIVVDGSDNFETRYVVSDACERAGKPLISGSILRFAGQLSLFWSAPDFPPGSAEHQTWPAGSRGPTYRDLFPEPPDPGEVPTCAEAGVLGALPAVIGSLMATETIKFLAQIGQSLLGRVLTYDALSSRFSEFALYPDPQRELLTPTDEPLVHGTTSGATGNKAAETDMPDSADVDFNPFTGEPKTAQDYSPKEFSEIRRAGGIGTILDVREPWEYAAGAIQDAVNIPLGELAERVSSELLADGAPTGATVIYCAHGIRSVQAQAQLQQRFPEITFKNLLGGYELYRSTTSTDQ